MGDGHAAVAPGVGPAAPRTDKVIRASLHNVGEAVMTSRHARDRHVLAGFAPGGSHGLESESSVRAHNANVFAQRVWANLFGPEPPLARDDQILDRGAVGILFRPHVIDPRHFRCVRHVLGQQERMR